MLLKDEVQMLRCVPLFAGIDPAKLKLLAFTSDRVNYAEGQELFHQGDVGDSAYVIISGTADIVVDSPAGEIKISEVTSRAVVGEVAILCNKPRNATVRAATPLECLRISKEYFLKLLSGCPRTMAETMRVLGERLETAN